MEFGSRGLGYAANWPEPGVEFEVSHLRRERGGLTAELKVTTYGPGLPDGPVHQARINLSALTTRTTLAKYLLGRTAGAEVEWVPMIEEAFAAIVAADRIGSPMQAIDLSEPQPPTLPYLIHGFARRGVVTWLFGPGGAGKTTLMTAMAMSLSAGREVVPGLAPAARGTVLYLDWETDKEDFVHRAAQIASGAGMAGAGSLIYRRCERPVADEAEELARLVGEREVIAVFIDSAGLAIGHSSEGMEAAEPTLRFFRACRVMRSTVIVADHVTKSSRVKSGSTAYGSIYKENLARASWELRKVTQTEDEVRVGLHLRKANNERTGRAYGFRIGFDLDGVHLGATEAPVEDNELGLPERILARLESDDGVTVEVLAAMVDRVEGSVRRTLFRLKKAGRVDHEEGRWFIVPEAPPDEVHAEDRALDLAL